MSVKKQLDWEFECDISGCSLNEKVYYTKWHQDDPSLSFLEMLRLQTEMREESEKEEWERHMADEAYYAEEEERLLAAEAERLAQDQEPLTDFERQMQEFHDPRTWIEQMHKTLALPPIDWESGYQKAIQKEKEKQKEERLATVEEKEESEEEE